MDVTLLIRLLESGHFEASVLGLPACRVEAESRELAIADLKNALLNQIKDAEVVSLRLPIAVSSPTENSWNNLFGIFRDDVYFEEVVELIQAERDALGDAEIDPGYYLPES